MQQTICGNFLYNLSDTLSISCLFSTTKVKILSLPFFLIRNINWNNPQVTKAFNSRVGTSEAIRLLNIDTNPKKIQNFKSNKKLIQWLAGLIDSNGRFFFNKQSIASLEILINNRDEHALQIIKNIYGGSIKLRSGCQTLRYKLQHEPGLLRLIKDVNGEIRDPMRLIQFKKILYKFNLNLDYPAKLNYYNGWLSGVFDGQGVININFVTPHLVIIINLKTLDLLKTVENLYSGNIFIDRNFSQNNVKLYIKRKVDILNLLEYFKVYPSRTVKNNRLHLIPKFYELRDISAHEAYDDTLLGKTWKYFLNSWLNYDNKYINNINYLSQVINNIKNNNDDNNNNY
jgi:hypothetical protein